MRKHVNKWKRGACSVLCALFFVQTAAFAADSVMLTPEGLQVVEPQHRATPPERIKDTLEIYGEAALASVSASAYAVYDVQGGRFIASSNGDAVLPMASTTKIMTAIVALETYEPDDTVKFDKTMTAIGSSMYLKYGEVVSVRDLLYGLMLMSGNDAARALAAHYEGGEAAFVAAMNAKACELGLVSTSFANPNGLDAEGHHTTARELALVAAYAMKNPMFREIAATKNGTFAGRLMNNHNRLLRQLDGCIGVKTGYTTGAGRCLVSAVERDGREVIIVTLRCSNDWREHTNLHEWAASHFTPRDVATGSYTLPVFGGEAQNVEVKPAEPLRLSLSDDESTRLKTLVYLPRFVYADVQSGTVVGRVEVTLDGETLAETELLTAGDAAMAAPAKLSFGERVQDFLETLAWSFGF